MNISISLLQEEYGFGNSKFLEMLFCSILKNCTNG